MFDELQASAHLCAGSFRDSVRDGFGQAIVSDVLDPVLRQVDALNAGHEEFQRQSLMADMMLGEARAIRPKCKGDGE